MCRFETAWPIPLVIVAATCGLLTAVSWAIFAVKMLANSDDEDELKVDEDEGPYAQMGGVVRLAGVIGVITLGIATWIIHWLRRRITLKNHVEALHLLYVYDKMPLTGTAQVQFQMTLKAGQRIGSGSTRSSYMRHQHYTVYSDGSFRSDAELTCC